MFGTLKRFGKTAMLGNKFDYLLQHIDHLQTSNNKGDHAAEYLISLLYYAKKDILDVAEEYCTSDFMAKSFLSTKLKVPYLSDSQTYPAVNLIGMVKGALSNLIQDFNHPAVEFWNDYIANPRSIEAFEAEFKFKKSLKDFQPSDAPEFVKRYKEMMAGL